MARTMKKAAERSRAGRVKGATRGQPATPAVQRWVPPPVPEWKTAREHPQELDGFRVGDSVRVVDEPGATYRIMEFTVPVHPDDPALHPKETGLTKLGVEYPTGPWADVYGGAKHYAAQRAFPVSKLRSTKRVHMSSRISDQAAEKAEARKTVPGGTEAVARAIREAREAAGMNRGQLAEKCGLQYGLLTRFELGQRGVTDDELEALRKALPELELPA